MFFTPICSSTQLTPTVSIAMQLGLATQPRVRTPLGFLTTPDHRNATPRFVPHPSPHHLLRFAFRPIRCRPLPSRLVLISCDASRRSSDGSTDDHDFLEASLLVPETIAHYRMRKQGYQEEMTWQSDKHFPFNVHSARGSRLLGEQGFLRRFHSPTIFLKISCDGDFLLPIIVGDFAIEKLITAIRGDDGDCPDQYQFVRNVTEKLGYKVKMVRITDRVYNTYFARLYFTKRGEDDILSVDARPSDAINVAARSKAPIYVSKQIVFTDAIKIGGYGRARDSRPSYDVSLDSAADGPDALAEELDLVRRMNLAIQEERYKDAAILRDKLMELRKSRYKH